MKKTTLAAAVEITAILLLGLMAGFFFAFAIDVAPAMAKLDASAYVTTQQWINRVVRNAVFGAAYFGSTLMPFLVVALTWRTQRRRALGWLAVATVYFVAVFWITRSINVPINNELATWNASAPPADWQQARDVWNQSNLVRAIASFLCFCAAVVMLTVSRRAERT